MSIPRIRSIRAALDEIRLQDPNSQITRHMIDLAVENKEIFCTRYGRRKMVNVDEVIGHFSGGYIVSTTSSTSHEEEKEGKIGEIW